MSLQEFLFKCRYKQLQQAIFNKALIEKYHAKVDFYLILLPVMATKDQVRPEHR